MVVLGPFFNEGFRGFGTCVGAVWVDGAPDSRDIQEDLMQSPLGESGRGYNMRA